MLTWERVVIPVAKPIVRNVEALIVVAVSEISAILEGICTGRGPVKADLSSSVIPSFRGGNVGGLDVAVGLIEQGVRVAI